MQNKPNLLDQYQLFISRFQPRLREVIIPETGHFISMDADGDLFGWAQMPRISYVVPRWIPDRIDRLHAYLGKLEAAGLDWQSCCFPIPLDWKTGALRTLIMRIGRDLPGAWI